MPIFPASRHTTNSQCSCSSQFLFSPQSFLLQAFVAPTISSIENGFLFFLSLIVLMPLVLILNINSSRKHPNPPKVRDSYSIVDLILCENLNASLIRMHTFIRTRATPIFAHHYINNTWHNARYFTC